MTAEVLRFERPRAGAAERPVQGHVTGAVRYLERGREKPVTYVAPPGAGEHRRTASYTPTLVRIRDARRAAGALSLDQHGFELRRRATAVRDLHDDARVRAVYYPEMERLVRAATGAARVVVFDHNVRVDGGAGEGASRVPVRIVHNDYTERSAPRRLRDLLPEQAARLPGRRFAVVNAWRPIVGPVRRSPLALIDAQSVAPEDLVAVDLVYPDRTGEIYEVAASAAHRWFYFPLMRSDEVLLIKGYDSLDDGRARFTPHTAFDDPATPAGAPPRRSIEIRSLVLF